MAKSKKRSSKKKSAATLETGALFGSEKAVIAELDSSQTPTREEEDAVIAQTVIGDRCLLGGKIGGAQHILHEPFVAGSS